jgi:hypothetical protein
MLHKLAIALIILSAVASAEPPSPVQTFDAFLKKATATTASSTPTYFNAYKKQWAKRRFRIEGLKMDVRKTDSLVTPLLGLVSFTLHTEQTDFFPTEQQAKAADKADPKTQTAFEITLRYGFQDSAWVFLDGTHRDPGSAVTATTFPINEEKFRAEPNAIPFAALLNWRQKEP